ncbi:MAG: hypothetical protein FWH37_08015 [Candidatus Bathyarchaeota archaeon]|nr:hypothetical protein [Candidatus Termiticorpusculum sp.]
MIVQLLKIIEHNTAENLIANGLKVFYMSNPENSVQYIKCPYCTCIFFTEADLCLHIKRFGDIRDQHISDYKEVNAKIEYGYSSYE